MNRLRIVRESATPNAVENYEERDKRPEEETATPAPARGSSELAIDPATLQTLIRDLIVDADFAREMKVSPSKTLRKVDYLTERDRARLSNIDSGLLSSLAEAASRYAEAIGAKQRVMPVGMSESLQRGLKGIQDFGPGSGGHGMPGDLGRFLPGSGIGISVGGREITKPQGDLGSGGGSGGGRRSRGGLSRGQMSSLGIPGGFSDDLAALGGGGPGPGGPPPIDLGFLGDFERPFGGDALATARAWHRLNPGGAASEGDKPGKPPPPPKPDSGSGGSSSGSDSGSGSGSTTGSAAPPVPPSATPPPVRSSDPGDPNSPQGGRYSPTPNATMTPGYGEGKNNQGSGHSVVFDIAAGAVIGAAAAVIVVKMFEIPVPPIWAWGGGAVLGGAIGAGYHEQHHRDRPPEDGHRPAEDGHRPAEDGHRPAEDGHRLARRWSAHHLYLPNPEDAGPGSPTTKALAALVNSTHALLGGA